MNKPFIQLSFSLLLLAIFSSSHALEWTPRLEQAAQGEFRDPMETFRLYIPAEVPIEVLKTLALELDNIDVTAMVNRDGSFAEFTPVQPLAWGSHTLRLVEYADDGSIVERGQWVFEVRRSSIFREIDYAGDINLIASQRIADKNLVNPGEEEPSGFSGQGSAVFQGRIADDDWEASGQIDLIYSSEEELTVNGDRLDMGEYLIQAQIQSLNTQTSLGHHSLPQSSLVMEGFHRRGVSGSVALNNLKSSVSGFALRAEEVIGFQNGLGIGDKDNRVDGVVWETRPLSDNPQQLYLAATYLSGSSNKTGESVGAEDADQSGDAWALVADSTILDEQLRIRGEIAGTTIDRVTADTADTDLINESADAISLSATYSPQSVDTDNTFFWNTGLEFSQIDTYFISLANPGLPADKELNRLFFNADWQGISAQLSAAKETDNVDDIVDQPRIETKLNQLALNYSLPEAPPEDSWLNTIGIPSLTVQLSNSQQKQIKEALDSMGNPLYADLDINNDMTMLAANFNKESWSWGMTFSESQQEDKITPANDQITYSRDLNANIQINDQFVITPSIQSQTTQISFDSSTSDTELYKPRDSILNN